jgi:hypothetical protein
VWRAQAHPRLASASREAEVGALARCINLDWPRSRPLAASAAAAAAGAPRLHHGLRTERRREFATFRVCVMEQAESQPDPYRTVHIAIWLDPTAAG